jgi:phytoene dehydrogenase-like protein
VAGARIEPRAAAARVEHDGAVRGVRLAGGSFRPAAAMIVAATPRVAAELVEDSPALRAAADAATPVRAACLDVGLRRLTRPGVTFALGLDRPLYYSVHSRTARLAPEGAAMVHVAKYLAVDDGSDAKEVERELEGLLDLAQPGWRGELAARRYLPDMAVVGALAGAAGGGLGGRPAPDAAGVAGLYLAGDWVGPEGWLSDASLASTRRACAGT